MAKPIHTKDFEEFISAECLDADDFHDIHALYVAVQTGNDENGDYRLERGNNGALVVTGRLGNKLVLVSEAAKEAFLKRLEEFAHDDGFEGDMDSWELYRAAMANPNA